MLRIVAPLSLLLCVCLPSCPLSASAAGNSVKPPPATTPVTIVLRGADTDQDIRIMLQSLRTSKAVQVKSEGVSTGFRRFGNRFSSPLVVQLKSVPGGDDVHVGQLAELLDNTSTPHRSEHPPGANLILFTTDGITEESVSALRSSLSQVNGIDVEAAGGLGANIEEGWFWIRLDPEGGAMLNDILTKARRSGLTLQTQRN